jgi:hypothetical protein
LTAQPSLQQGCSVAGLLGCSATKEPSNPATQTGAGGGTRTRDLLITNQLLYQLSYASKLLFQRHDQPEPTEQRMSFDGAAEEQRVITELPNGVQEVSYSGNWRG